MGEPTISPQLNREKRSPGRTKARLSEVTIITRLRDTNKYDGVRVSETRENQSQRDG